jgi:serine protease Do
MARFLRGMCDAKTVFAAAIVVSIASAAPPDAEPVWFRAETDPAELKRTLADDGVSDRWIYHDLEAARAAARQSGKPILAIFRCVPCGSVPKLDDQISAADGPLADLLDRFVCARVVKMNGVDRNVFDFDRDVPYVAMIVNADGAVYGRWGTRVSASRSELSRHTLGSFQTALEKALELHAGYPANRDALAGKSTDRVRTPPLPEEMPTMRPFGHNPPEVKNCIHCHMVGEANLELEMRDRKLTTSDLWPFPPADNIGIRLDVNEGLTVKTVTRDSPAERAGVRAGDVLVRLNGQPLVSEADVQWALDHLPDDARPKLELERNGLPLEVELEPTGEWRKFPTEWRASLQPLRPNVNLRPQFGQKGSAMALGVNYPRGKASDAGLRQGDVVIGVDGRNDLRTEADFLRYIHLDRADAQTAELEVLRKGEKLSITLPLR